MQDIEKQEINFCYQQAMRRDQTLNILSNVNSKCKSREREKNFYDKRKERYWTYMFNFEFNFKPIEIKLSVSKVISYDDNNSR